MKWLFVAAVLLWSGRALAQVPTLVQNVSSSTNAAGVGIDGNNFKFTLPNAVLAGNALVLKVAYLSGSTFAATPITDSNGNTWPTTPSASVVDSNVNVDMAIFVLPNARAGVTTLTINFTASIHPVQYDCGEWRNVDTSSPVDGSVSTSNVPGVPSTSETVSVGSFTPSTNNDANGGHLILAYIWDDANAGSGNAVSLFAAGGSFTLLDADITWQTDANAHHASEYFVQTANAAINPSFSVTMTPAGDPFVGIAIALKAASAGTTPAAEGVRLVKMHHFTNMLPGAGPLKVQFPSTGSSMVVMTWPACTGCKPITSVTDGTNTFVGYQDDASEPWIYVAEGGTFGSTSKFDVNLGAGASTGMSLRFFEFYGALPSGSVDAHAGMPATDCSLVTTIAHAPDITPPSLGLTVATMGIGNGPGTAVTSPSGAFFDLVTYTGEIDLDTMENADAMGHFSNPDLSAENWTWTIASRGPAGTNSCFAMAVHIKSLFNPTPKVLGIQFPPVEFPPIGTTLGKGTLFSCSGVVIGGFAECSGWWIFPGTPLVCQGVSKTPLDIAIVEQRNGSATLQAVPFTDAATVQCLGGNP